MSRYVRPLVQSGAVRPVGAVVFASGPLWFSHVEILSRDAAPKVVPASDVDVSKLTQPRARVAGLDMTRPTVMGILNVTPDSFSDGGAHEGVSGAVKAAQQMIADGAGLIDIGGESTRPGADLIDPELEIARTAPVIEALRAQSDVLISIDTRKAVVARAAVEAGASLVNDVSGFTFDGGLAPYCASAGLPVCVMHAQGDPQTMQQNPSYDDVLLDVYDFLAAQIEALVAQGIARDQIIADPGIGFGKTLAHNLALLNRISLFHSLGVPILLGASRKKFIGTIAGVDRADQRVAGSVAVALAAVAQGVQIVRVHDVEQTVQALKLWQAIDAREHHV